MASRDDLLDELLKEYQNPEDLLGKNGIVRQLTKDLIERALAAELTDHLGYDKHAVAGRGSGNSRNGTSGKTLKTEQGDLRLEIPRDRQGDFEPLLVAKGQGPTAQRRVRRTDHLVVCSRPDRGRDSRAFRGDLWHRSLPWADLDGDRCGG